MSYRQPAGTRAYCLPHPDRALYDPFPGQATKEAWSAIQFDRDLAELEAAVKRRQAFGQKISVDTPGKI